MMFYFEEVNFAGRWCPRTSDHKPVVVGAKGINRTKSYGNQGPRIRSMTEIPTYLQHLTLGQKREVFSPDGAFYCQNRGK